MPTIVLGWVCLQVSSLECSQAFYERIGLRTALLKPPFAVLTSADTATALLILWERPGTHPAAPDMTGLYHVALRLPGETALAGVLRHLLRQGIPLEGASDHLVSQALYLSDPDGNGIELYADRPRHTWQRCNGELLMATRPLDVERLLSRAPAPLPILPEGTSIGHLHLRVAQLDAAERFYAGMLGLEVQLRSYPGALSLPPTATTTTLGSTPGALLDGSPASTLQGWFCSPWVYTRTRYSNSSAAAANRLQLHSRSSGWYSPTHGAIDCLLRRFRRYQPRRRLQWVC